MSGCSTPEGTSQEHSRGGQSSPLSKRQLQNAVTASKLQHQTGLLVTVSVPSTGRDTAQGMAPTTLRSSSYHSVFHLPECQRPQFSCAPERGCWSPCFELKEVYTPLVGLTAGHSSVLACRVCVLTEDSCSCVRKYAAMYRCKLLIKKDPEQQAVELLIIWQQWSCNELCLRMNGESDESFQGQG